MLGATPHLGRILMRDDYHGDMDVGVLGYGVWQRQWGGDPRPSWDETIGVEGRPVVVAGILSPDFDPPEAVTGPGSTFGFPWM